MTVTVCILITAFSYQGRGGESYSLFNHFISELGEAGVSRLGWLFNAGLVAGGLLFLPFSLGLGLALPGWLSKLGGIAGVVAAISLAGVGIFPMNNLEPHITAAMTYFRSGLFTVVLFGLAIQLQPKGQIVLDKRVNLASLLAVVCYGSFLFYMQLPTKQASSNLDLSWMVSRPSIWLLAILEWSIFFSTILWFTVIALGRKRSAVIPQ
ncbi:MAG: DUF998 domain-containing protein [Anaerolineales bacterium]